jgi:hypothetical protein
MCCASSALLVIGPRALLFLWWMADTARFQVVFGGAWIVPLLGLILLPWLTMAWVIVSPGGVQGLEWLVLAAAVAGDLGSVGASGVARQRRSALDDFGEDVAPMRTPGGDF